MLTALKYKLFGYEDASFAAFFRERFWNAPYRTRRERFWQFFMDRS